MKKNLIYFILCLIIITTGNSCLKYKELSKINGLEIDAQGATPLFSYNLTIQDLLTKNPNLNIDKNNRIYFWTEDIKEDSATGLPGDLLYQNIPVGKFIGKDSVSFNTSDFADNFPQFLDTFIINRQVVYPTISGKMLLDNPIIKIIKLDKISGNLKLKITNNFEFPVDIKISFPEFTILPIDTFLEKNSEIDILRPITNMDWTGNLTNTISYNIDVTIRNAPYISNFFPLPELLDNLQNANVTVEDTLIVEKYDAIFGNVGSERYLFTENIRHKINITDPFIKDTINKNSKFPNIRLEIDYKNDVFGVDITGVLFNARFKMKDGTIVPIKFLDKTTGLLYNVDSFIFPLGIDKKPTFDGPPNKIPTITLDTPDVNFQGLDIDIKEIDSFLYSIKYYSLKTAPENTSSFIRQPDRRDSPLLVNSASGKLIIPYILSATIFVGEDKTPVIVIPEKFYDAVDSVIKYKNGTGELQEIELAMTIENNSIFSAFPQVYFIDTTKTDSTRKIDSLRPAEQVRVPPATLSPGGIVRLPNTITIRKKLTPSEWGKFKQVNKLTSTILLVTSKEEQYPAITSSMYIKFYFKIGNVGFKYFIKKK